MRDTLWYFRRIEDGETRVSAKMPTMDTVDSMRSEGFVLLRVDIELPPMFDPASNATTGEAKSTVAEQWGDDFPEEEEKGQ